MRVFLLFSFLVVFLSPCVHGDQSSVAINEFHYDNSGTDVNEAVEVIALAGTDLTGWTLVFYNGNGGASYDTVPLSGTLSNDHQGYGFFVATISGIQNGPDGIALVTPHNHVKEFICYEASFQATDGPAVGATCLDIGVSETGTTPTTSSLQKTQCINSTVWILSNSTFGSLNFGQSPVLCSSTPTPSPSTLAPMSTRIFHVQGSGLQSSMVASMVQVPGIVTALATNGFFMQDQQGDDDETTSDAIFVYVGSSPIVAVGDSLIVIGSVTEYIPSSSPYSQPLTQLTSPQIEIVSSGNTLPAPVLLGDDARSPPTQSIVSGIEFYESLECMRVTALNPKMISSKSRYAEYWVVLQNGANSTGLSSRGALTLTAQDFNPERLQIDYNSASLSDFSAPDAQLGDEMSSVTGVLSYGYGSYELIATEPFTVTPRTLPSAVTSITKTDSNIVVGSLNAYNLDPSDGSRFGKLASMIVNNMDSPDVIALQEIQDDNGADSGEDVSASLTLQTLVDEIAAVGGPTYVFVDNPFIGNNTSGGQPYGNIRCAFIYNNDRVQFLSSETVVNESDQQTNPENPFYNSRLPLVGNFISKSSSEAFQIVNVHFSSKGGSAPLFGTLQPVEELQDETTVNGNVDDRLEQATAVSNFISNSSTTNKIIVGDFNEFHFNTPVLRMDDGMSVLMNKLPERERYSYIYEGNAQALDQVLVSDNLAASAQFEIVHCNTGYSDFASDHDPLIVSLQI